MSCSYPGGELSVEQLVYALARALDPNALSRRKLFEAGPQKISVIEQDLCGIIRVTREMMNISVPINKLPPEILSRILEHRTHERTLIIATHVCQYWRSTLIFNPSLWTCFHFVTQPDVARTLAYLERSRSAPIDVSISTGSPQGVKALRHLAPHASRMRFCLINGSDADAQAVFSLFHNPSPFLQCLGIYSYEYPPFIPDDSHWFDSFSGVSPMPPESPFPLPNLIDFTLYRQGGPGSFRLNTVFRFLSYSPRLQKLRISTTGGTLQEITLDRVVTLESLVELDYTCRPADRILPLLRLPRLKWLRVHSSPEPGQAQNLADLLPHGGRLLLAGATKMEYSSSDSYPHRVVLSGKEVEVSLTVARTTAGPPFIDWISDETYIPLGRIKELGVSGWSVTSGFPFGPFRSLEVLRVYPRDAPTEDFWSALYPGVGLACRSLREIRYDCHGSLPALVSLAKERKKAGHQLGLVWLLASYEPDQDTVGELREYVGEVRFETPLQLQTNFLS